MARLDINEGVRIERHAVDEVKRLAAELAVVGEPVSHWGDGNCGWLFEAVEKALQSAGLYVPPSQIPSTPRTKCAVYRFFDTEGRLLYVGKSVNPVRRREDHRKRAWWKDVKNTSIEWFPSEKDALRVEDMAIRDECPLYNRMRTNPDRAVS